MRLTNRGRAVAWSSLFVVVFIVGVLTGPYGIDYYSSGCPCLVKDGGP